MLPAEAPMNKTPVVTLRLVSPPVFWPLHLVESVSILGFIRFHQTAEALTSKSSD